MTFTEWVQATKSWPKSWWVFQGLMCLTGVVLGLLLSHMFGVPHLGWLFSGAIHLVGSVGVTTGYSIRNIRRARRERAAQFAQDRAEGEVLANRLAAYFVEYPDAKLNSKEIFKVLDLEPVKTIPCILALYDLCHIRRTVFSIVTLHNGAGQEICSAREWLDLPENGVPDETGTLVYTAPENVTFYLLAKSRG